jgi:nicotinamidase-related amidase
MGLLVDHRTIRRMIRPGYNISVEAYSIFKSEVENFSDPLAGLNHKLLANLNSGDTEVRTLRLSSGSGRIKLSRMQIHVCGQALSHVVRFSLEDLLKKTTQPARNISLLLNCMYLCIDNLLWSSVMKNISWCRRIYCDRIFRRRRDLR